MNFGELPRDPALEALAAHFEWRTGAHIDAADYLALARHGSGFQTLSCERCTWRECRAQSRAPVLENLQLVHSNAAHSGFSAIPYSTNFGSGCFVVDGRRLRRKTSSRKTQQRVREGTRKCRPHTTRRSSTLQH